MERNFATSQHSRYLCRFSDARPGVPERKWTRRILKYKNYCRMCAK
jgi:hypothetical protein